MTFKKKIKADFIPAIQNKKQAEELADELLQELPEAAAAPLLTYTEQFIFCQKELAAALVTIKEQQKGYDQLAEKNAALAEDNEYFKAKVEVLEAARDLRANLDPVEEEKHFPKHFVRCRSV